MSFPRALRDLPQTLWRRGFAKSIPPETDPETLRRAQLIFGFCMAGGLFSLAYAMFYLAIGHSFGAGIILFHSLFFSTLSLRLVLRRRLDAAASCFVLTLLSMFCALCATEGGTRGHAVAWLACIPVSVQLLMAGQRRALAWCGIALAMVGAICGLEIAGVAWPVTYPWPWHGWVTLVGYVGLAAFLTVLAYLSEHYRISTMRQRDLAQAELRGAVDELTRLHEEKNEFLGIAAHDLNNPLTVVRGYAGILESLDASEIGEVRDIARQISESAGRMQGIIRDVLDVNRMESGEYPLSLSRQNLRPLAEGCVDRHQMPGAAKGLVWQVALEDAFARIDAGAFSQVLDNLVSNAVKYADPGGRIELRLAASDAGAVFRIFNEGRGFSEEDKAKLFGRFAKLSTRPTGGESSIGLGLSIVKKIVGAMGGRIRCESTLHQGAAFVVEFPAE